MQEYFWKYSHEKSVMPLSAHKDGPAHVQSRSWLWLFSGMNWQSCPLLDLFSPLNEDQSVDIRGNNGILLMEKHVNSDPTLHGNLHTKIHASILGNPFLVVKLPLFNCFCIGSMVRLDERILGPICKWTIILLIPSILMSASGHNAWFSDWDYRQFPLVVILLILWIT